MNNNIHNWRYNNAVVYTSSYGLSLQVHEYKLERRQKFTTSRRLGYM